MPRHVGRVAYGHAETERQAECDVAHRPWCGDGPRRGRRRYVSHHRCTLRDRDPPLCHRAGPLGVRHRRFLPFQELLETGPIACLLALPHALGQRGQELEDATWLQVP